MFYNFMRCIAALLLIATRRIRFYGKENIPKDGAVMLVSNHISAFDPILVGLATHRQVHFVAKKELFKGKFLNWFMHKMNCIPIDRENLDRAALRDSISVLKDGGMLGVFPEGTRGNGKELLPFKSGVCFIASQSPCTIVPVGVRYGGHLLNPFSKPAEVRIGEPFPYEALEGEKRRDTLNRMLARQEEAVKALAFPETNHETL